MYFPHSAKEMGELGSKVMAEEGIRYWISPGGDSIICTECRKTSHNPHDVEKRYCGFCHEFLDELPPEAFTERSDAREAFALFETMRTDELLRLRRAHQFDQAHATRPESIVFGAGRLALIAKILRDRKQGGRLPDAAGKPEVPA